MTKGVKHGLDKRVLSVFLGVGLWQSVKAGRRPEATVLILGLELPVCGRMLGIW